MYCTHYTGAGTWNPCFLLCPSCSLSLSRSRAVCLSQKSHAVLPVLLLLTWALSWDKIFLKQECIPVVRVPPALYRMGGLCPAPPRQRPDRRNTGPETDSLERTWDQRQTPWKEHGTRDRDPPEGTWDQAVRHEVTSYRDPL